jgi:hypothetical protein
VNSRRTTRKLSVERHKQIVNQGKAQFMAMGYEDSRGKLQCPYKPDGTHLGDVIVKLWMKGYAKARVDWFRAMA